MIQIIKDKKKYIKRFLVKLFTSFLYSATSFVVLNILFSFLYYCLSTEANLQYNYIKTIIHTFIASFTLSTPSFIKFPTEGYIIDIIVLVHVGISYLFLGILISMIYRKVTRT